MYRVCYRNVTLNEIGEIILKTRFIGLEGFNEIESLSTTGKSVNRRKLNKAQKTVRFIKRATTLCVSKLKIKSKNISAIITVKSAAGKQSDTKSSCTPVLDRHYNENRSGAKSEFSCSAREAVAGFSLKSNKVYAHSAPANSQRTHAVLKKKAVLAVVACMSAVTLSCVTVASALDYSGNDNSDNTVKKTFSAEQIASENTENTQPANVVLLNSSTADEALGTIGEDAYSSIKNAIVSENANHQFVGLYIDNKLIGATDESEALQNALDKILVDYRKDYDDTTTTEFANSVEIKAVSALTDGLIPADELIDKADGKLSIALSTDIVYTREVNYETKTEYDDSKPSSYEEIKTEGVKGKEEVTVRTTFVDGVQTDAVETEAKTLKKTVNKVIIKGSRDGVSSSSSSVSSSSGSFCWPMPYTHNLTSTFGERWGRLHGGLDIAAGGIYGQPIIAAADGTVTFSGGDDTGYGYHVMIDHGNGYSTLYGHCSSLAVSSEQYVSQGDVIGYVGSTGNSTGPHLHFEIRVNGVQTDPLGYVS